MVFRNQGNRFRPTGMIFAVSLALVWMCVGELEAGAQESGTIHIAEAQGTGVDLDRRWLALVSVTVHDSEGSPVPDVVVTGWWEGGATGVASCLTDANGSCQVLTARPISKKRSVLFTVSGLAHAVRVYSPSDNEVPAAVSVGWAQPPLGFFAAGALQARPGTLHVGDMDFSTSGERGWYVGSVRIQVEGADHVAVPDATVQGSWVGAGGGWAVCTTDESGSCAVSKGSYRKELVAFVLTSIDHPSLAFDPAAAHDPDGDSDGRMIVGKLNRR